MDLQKYDIEIKSIMDEINRLESGEFLEAGAGQEIENAKAIAKNIRVLFLELLVKISNHKEEPGDPFSNFF